MTTTRLTTFRRIVEAREGHTRRATHATTRQRRALGNPPRAPLRTPLGARAFPSVRGRGSRTESRRFGVGSAKPPAHFTFSTCSRASPAGRGWTAAAGSANASAPGWKGNRVISRTHRQVRQNARVTAAGSTARFRDAFFSRRPLFLAFFPVRLTRDFLSSPTPAEEEEQVYAQLATLRDHLPTRYAPRRPGNARVERTPRLTSTRPSAVCRTHSPRFGPGRRRRVPFRKRARPEHRGGAAARIETRSDSTTQRSHARLTSFPPSFPPRRTRHRDAVEEFLLGAGANGVAFVEGPRVSVALEGDIAVYFQGDTHRALSDEHESHAHEILAAYRDRGGGSNSGSANDLSGFLSGEFSVVVFDKLAGRVLAARDPNGAEPLFWGTADFGNALLFSTDAGLLAKQCADADAFPAGTVFLLEVRGRHGRVNDAQPRPRRRRRRGGLFGRRRRRDGAAHARTAARAVRVAETRARARQRRAPGSAACSSRASSRAGGTRRRDTIRTLRRRTRRRTIRFTTRNRRDEHNT